MLSSLSTISTGIKQKQTKLINHGSCSLHGISIAAVIQMGIYIFEEVHVSSKGWARLNMFVWWPFFFFFAEALVSSIVVSLEWMSGLRFFFFFGHSANVGLNVALIRTLIIISFPLQYHVCMASTARSFWQNSLLLYLGSGLSHRTFPSLPHLCSSISIMGPVRMQDGFPSAVLHPPPPPTNNSCPL